jgi:hypothetical protein
MPASGEDDDRPAVVCATCGARPDDERALLSWSRGVERGRAVWTCPRCARENLRSIEAKLDQGFW